MVSEQNKKVNLADKFTSKLETGLGLVKLSFIGLIGIVIVDYGLTAVGFKDAPTTGNEVWTLFAINTGLLIGWMLGNKSKKD